MKKRATETEMRVATMPLTAKPQLSILRTSLGTVRRFVLQVGQARSKNS